MTEMSEEEREGKERLEEMRVLGEVVAAVEEAKALEGAGRVEEATRRYEDAQLLLQSRIDRSKDEEEKRRMRERQQDIGYRTARMKASRTPLGLRLVLPAEMDFVEGQKAWSSARDHDDNGDIPLAIEAYSLAASLFTRAHNHEPADHESQRRYLAERTALCLSRVEQLKTYRRPQSSASLKLLPVRFGFRPGDGSSIPEVPASSVSGLWNKLQRMLSLEDDDDLRTDLGSADERRIGTFLGYLPRVNGEWLRSVAFVDVISSQEGRGGNTYSVYVMEVVSEVFVDGELVDSVSWKVSRRFREFADLHGRISSLKIKTAPFPAKTLTHQQALAFSVVDQRRLALQTYFDHLCSLDPSPELNDLLLSFLRNSQQRADALS